MPLLKGKGTVHIGSQVFDVDLLSVSAANREGVEGEPQATLGGRPGSPRTGQWCRFCGSIANPSSGCCVDCWAKSLSAVMEISGQLTSEFMDSLTKATDSFRSAFGVLSQPQSHDPAIP
jgi:hypothetical protein